MTRGAAVIAPDDHCWISRVDHRAGVDWLESDNLVPYPAAIRFMERRAEAMFAGLAGECVWLLEHPPLYTAGTSARPDELLDAERFPVFASGRGGRFTYHGPGQRVIYPMLDLRKRGRDVRAFVEALEAWLIRALAEFGVAGEVRPGRIGVWTVHPQVGEAKIAAIGVRIRRWISYHGAALNVAPELDHFRGIVPCGLPEYRVTSLRDLGLAITMRAVDDVLKATFPQMMPVPAAPPEALAAQAG